jgi:hypothetical protein
MMVPLERRQAWSRIVGVERRAAPLQELEGHPLPDPTRLEDEEFIEARRELENKQAQSRSGPWEGPDYFE